MGRPVEVARVVRAHGIRGEVIVHRFGEGEDLLSRGAELSCRRAGHEFSLVVGAARRHKRDWIVQFEGVGSRNEAEALAGATFFMDSEMLPDLEDGTYYQFQLVGLEVETESGTRLGRVEEILETGARDVYVVRGSGEEILLPAIEQVIREVDLAAGKMVVTLMPGLVPEEAEPSKTEKGSGQKPEAKGS